MFSARGSGALMWHLASVGNSVDQVWHNNSEKPADTLWGQGQILLI